MGHIREQASVLALTAQTVGEWHKTASLIEEARGALRIVEGKAGDIDWLDRSTVEALGSSVTEELVDRYVELIGEQARRGVRLVTVLDDWCPNFPGPFLYYPSRRQPPPALQAFLRFVRDWRTQGVAEQTKTH